MSQHGKRPGFGWGYDGERHGAWQHHPGRGPWGDWGDWTARGGGFGGPGGPGGHRPGPPPWVIGLLGLDDEFRRGPRVRRGDVRSAIVDVLARADEEGEHVNGYQVIQRIADRSQGGWKPSPGSVYPTIQQLEDEGLVESDDEHGRRAIRLTPEGKAYAEEHAEDLAAVWRPFERPAGGPEQATGLRAEVAQVMPAVWQIATAGTPEQRERAAEILADTRRRLYGLLADGPGESEGADPAE